MSYPGRADEAPLGEASSGGAPLGEGQPSEGQPHGGRGVSGDAGPAPGSLVAVLGALGVPAGPAGELEEDLLVRWSEPHRCYHDRRHLAETLARVDALAAQARRPDIVRLAAWWHDAVHTGSAEAGADEAASAALAEQQLAGAGLPDAEVAEVSRLVRLTASHDPEPTDVDGSVLCDADLAVLAAPPQRYAQYARDVRAEHASVPDAAFRDGRARVLRRLLGRERLFRTPAGRAWEPAARANLTAELELLVGDGTAR